MACEDSVFLQRLLVFACMFFNLSYLWLTEIGSQQAIYNMNWQLFWKLLALMQMLNLSEVSWILSQHDIYRLVIVYQGTLYFSIVFKYQEDRSQNATFVILKLPIGWFLRIFKGYNQIRIDLYKIGNSIFEDVLCQASPSGSSHKKF